MSATQTDAQATATDPNWRSLILSDLPFPESLVDALDANSIITLGDVARITEDTREWSRLTSLPDVIPDATLELRGIILSHLADDAYAAEQAPAPTDDDNAAQAGADLEEEFPGADTLIPADVLLREVKMLRQHDTEARALADAAQELENTWMNLKDRTGAAKKYLDAKLIELREHAQSRTSPGPLFEQSPDEDAEPAETTDAPADDDAWRAVTLEELGIAGKTAELLAANDPPLVTLGALADWSGTGHPFSAIAGIGRAKAIRIEDACGRYWADHPRPEQTGVAGGEEDPGDGDGADAE